ncbi:hypothetical protein [Bradyrhizobium commune]|uniref:Uncharacterized protein n=1 Tax=Bradyrhizobium commune TaxID=83627 RepID=A0A7S9H345_9BRAD|nr:hypothetical protein [Bradyrhizobium commune]QPF94525.1 hypothetical protein IC761_15150 [Bradyrhizobium commune]
MSKASTDSRRSESASETFSEHEPWAVPEADIAAWAEREKKRRQAWLEGPNEEEKQAWADAERQRRKRQYREDLLDIDLFDIDFEEGRRMADRMMTGFTNRMVETPLRKLGDLLREGRGAESRQRDPLRRRRRVHPDDND